jgi:acetoin utilization deacetylase AcuC-like enzyme
MKVFYNPKMSTPSHGYSPSGSKPAAAVADWQNRGLDIQIVDFKPVTENDLCLAHDPRFVKRVLTGKESNGHGNTIKAVTDSCLWTCGSMVAASRQALIDGITCSPSSGFHHSGFSFNGCFCTWNALVIAARKMIEEGRVAKVGIIDCDAHWFDGVVDILDTLELNDVIKAWSFGGEFTTQSFSQRRLIAQLRMTIRKMKEQGVELILYQAGADPHINDPLGGLMTTEEMRERDELVFDMCANLGIPVAYAHAGGYIVESDGSIPQVLELHRNTAMEAIRALKSQVNPTPSPKKWIRLHDTTVKNLGESIAIVGGVRAPKRTKPFGGSTPK